VRAGGRARLDDQGEAIGQIIPWPAIEAHTLAVLAGDDEVTWPRNAIPARAVQRLSA
jgi:hypothetical protein